MKTARSEGWEVVNLESQHAVVDGQMTEDLLVEEIPLFENALRQMSDSQAGDIFVPGECSSPDERFAG